MDFDFGLADLNTVDVSEKTTNFEKLSFDEKHVVHALFSVNSLPGMKSSKNFVFDGEQVDRYDALFFKNLKGLCSLVMNDFISSGPVSGDVVKQLSTRYANGDFDSQAIEEFGLASIKMTADLSSTLFNIFFICRAFRSNAISYVTDTEKLSVVGEEKNFDDVSSVVHKMLTYQKFNNDLELNLSSFSSVSSRMTDINYTVLQSFFSDFVIAKTMIDQNDIGSKSKMVGCMKTDIVLLQLPFTVSGKDLFFHGLKTEVPPEQVSLLSKFLLTIWNPFYKLFIENNQNVLDIHHQQRELDPLKMILSTINLSSIDAHRASIEGLCKSMKKTLDSFYKETSIPDCLEFYIKNECEEALHLGLSEDNKGRFSLFLQFLAYLKFVISQLVKAVSYSSVSNSVYDSVINSMKNASNGTLTRSSWLKGDSLLTFFGMLQGKDNSKTAVVSTINYNDHVNLIGALFINSRSCVDKVTKKIKLTRENFGAAYSTLETIIIHQSKVEVYDVSFFITEAALEGKKVYLIESSSRDSSLLNVTLNSSLYSSNRAKMVSLDQDNIAILFQKKQSESPQQLQKKNQEEALQALAARKEYVQFYLQTVYGLGNQQFKNVDYVTRIKNLIKTMIPVFKDAPTFNDEDDFTTSIQFRTLDDFASLDLDSNNNNNNNIINNNVIEKVGKVMTDAIDQEDSQSGKTITIPSDVVEKIKEVHTEENNKMDTSDSSQKNLKRTTLRKISNTKRQKK